MAITSQLIESNDSTITMKLTSGAKEFTLTVVNHPDHTVEELVNRWTKRANTEYMQNPALFQKMFIDRINKRHAYLVDHPEEIK